MPDFFPVERGDGLLVPKIPTVSGVGLHARLRCRGVRARSALTRLEKGEETSHAETFGCAISFNRFTFLRGATGHTTRKS